MADRGKRCENDEIGDNLDEVCGEEEEIDSKSNEKFLEKEHQSEEPEDNVNRQQRYGPRKQLTRNRNVHDIDSSLDENNYKEIVYMNKDGVLEILCGYLCPMKNKNTKKIDGTQSIQWPVVDSKNATSFRVE